MAFTARTPEYYDSASSASGLVSVPSGTQDGDILFALIRWKNIYGIDLDVPPGGWNLLGSSGAPGQGKSFLYYRIASSEPANYTWTTTYAPSFPGQLRIAMYAYTAGDFDGADPIDVVSNTAYTTDNTTVRAAGMSVAAASSPMVFFGIGHWAAALSFTKPADIGADAWTEDDDAGASAGSEFHFTADSMIRSSSGATGDMDATASSSIAGKHAFAVALNPAASGYTLAAGNGSFAETGAAATLKATRKLAAANGSYAETGTAAALKLGRKMASLGGVFVLSGAAAGLRTTRLLSVASGSFIESGTAATLTYVSLKVLSAGAGAFALSGAAADLRATRILALGSGAFLETGTVVELLRGYKVAALSGTFLISGGVVYFPRPGMSRTTYIFQKRRDHFRI